jgi:hypothetical protein
MNRPIQVSAVIRDQDYIVAAQRSWIGVGAIPARPPAKLVDGSCDGFVCTCTGTTKTACCAANTCHIDLAGNCQCG